MFNQAEQNFLAQCYKDAWSDYITSLSTSKSAKWDWVVITASNESQAEAFRLQLDRRSAEGFLLPNTNYAVIPDVDGKRIGSGGATLNVLRYIGEQVGISNVPKLKILVFHSGGDSKRIPQYSVCGKLFAPVPRLLENGKQSTIFDELMILSVSIPERISAGMLIMPSDTLILFNSVQLDLFSCDAAGLSIKTDISTGREHGVFVADSDNVVTCFLHKQSEKKLRQAGAADASDSVNIDTGCIWFGSNLVEKLVGLISENNVFSDNLFNKYVNDKVCLSFYADFLFPLAGSATLEDYLNETPENVISDELLDCRRSIWEAVSNYKISLVKFHPAKYIHFGTLREFFDLLVWHIEDYFYLGWQKQIKSVACTQAVVSNSIVNESVALSPSCYIENSDVGENCSIGKNVVLSGVTLKHIQVPDNIMLNCVKLKNNNFVCRILGLDDNPKSSVFDTFLNGTVNDIFAKTNLTVNQICGDSATIWNAEIFPERKTPEEAVQATLVLYKIIGGNASDAEMDLWKNSVRYSFKSSFNQADVQALLDWNAQLEHRINVRNFISALSKDEPLSEILSKFEHGVKSDIELRIILSKAREAQFPLNMRIFHALSVICRKNNRTLESMDFDKLEDMAYETVKNVIVKSVEETHKFSSFRFIKESEIVELPVRVNFCGSPSDAAPYCLEHGGTMFDGTLLLNGKRPIKAEVRQLEEPLIVLESIDLKTRREVRSIEEILDCGNPFNAFALHKAVLIAAGVINKKCQAPLEEVLRKLGGGLHLLTFADVPKGSGLGTSSIVAAACIKALNLIFGQGTEEERIYAQVFAAEQLMNTGGGWQDQVGGLTPGLKFIRSGAGYYQKINVETVILNPCVAKELNERFALIFSGQRRLARNVLREELNRCIENETSALNALDRIRNICVLMKFELERGNIGRFARYVTEQFELVKLIDKGASNTYIEYIFEVCDDLIDGKAICGAGGGGFLQVILKKGVTKAMLQKRLETVFKDCGVKLWDCELI